MALKMVITKLYIEDNDFKWSDEEEDETDAQIVATCHADLECSTLKRNHQSEATATLHRAGRLDEAFIPLIEDAKVKSIVKETNKREKQIFTGKGKEFIYPTEWDSDQGCGIPRYKVHRFIDSLPMKTLSMILVFVDVAMVIASVLQGPKLVYSVVSLTIVSYFMLELILKIFAWGKEFFMDKLDIFDGVIIITTFTVTVVMEIMDLYSKTKYAGLIVFFRFMRFVLYIRIFINVWGGIITAVRHKATQSKKRYIHDGYDLDLTYITPRVIAMSFPSSGVQELRFPITKRDLELAIRNKREEVVAFFNDKHEDHYRIYNLCKERGYDPGVFNNQVYRMMIDDHNVPKLSELLDFCHDVDDWMKKDKENVIAVHCKGGKGRTGCCIAAWLLYSGVEKTAKKSLEFFGGRRMDVAAGVKYQGVETPSQKRYVHYLETILRKMGGKMPPAKKLILRRLEIRGLSVKAYTDMHMEVVVDDEVVCKFDIKKARDRRRQMIMNFDPENNIMVAGDVKFRFMSPYLGKDYDHCSFFFWVHTSFLQDNKFEANRAWIGNAHKHKHWKKYPKNFLVKLRFAEPIDEKSEGYEIL